MRISSKIKKISFLIFYFLLISSIQNCTDPHFLDIEGVPSKIAGRVTGNSGFSEAADTNDGIAGAAVRIARIKQDGSFETISTNAVSTGAGGNFIIETEINNESELVVIAEKNGTIWKAVVSSQVKNGVTIFCQPLNYETSAETEIFTIARRNQTLLSYFEIAEYINSKAASQVNNNSDLAAELAASLSIQSGAMASAFANPGIGGTQPGWEVINLAMKDAQAVLERNLNFAVSKCAVDAAFQSYYNAAMSAYINSGFPGETFIKLLEISDQVFKKNNSLNAELKFELEKKIASLKVQTIDIAVRYQFGIISATPEQINKVISAGETVKSSIDSSFSAEDITNTFNTYRIFIRNELEDVLGIYGQLLTGIDSAVILYKSELKDKIASVISSEEIISAYINFYLQVDSEVDFILSAADDQQRNATTEIFIITNLF